MTRLNLSNRIVMYAICTSIEYDIKSFILKSVSSIDFDDEMDKKIKGRAKNASDISDKIDQLDLIDLISIIISKPFDFNINNEKSKLLSKYFEKIIPIRNRVMHTKPFEIGDKATLFDILENIENSITWLRWSRICELRKTLQENPSSLINQEYIPVVNYDSNILHNLPLPEFDDTGFIGRAKEQDDIKKLVLELYKNQIITIIGSGGIGKTALVVKVLYDLIDNQEFDFEAIIWITLKARTLSDGEFIELNNTIDSLSNIFDFAKKQIITDDQLSAEENLINFMSEFNVLLVLDNLETLNDTKINKFLKSIPPNSKTLITSRLGIGELENRYPVNKMRLDDSVVYFRELSKYFGLNQHQKSDKEIKQIIKDNLYSSPLAIKWYMSGIYKGISEGEMISQKNDLIEFCMSNIFDRLGDIAKKIIQLFLIENYELVYGEIDFYLNQEDINTRKAINELFVTNIIKLNSGKYTLDEMMRDYLLAYNPPKDNFIKFYYKKKRLLNSMLQDIKVKKENDPFNPKSLFANLKNTNRKLASYYLIQALEFSSKSDYIKSYDLIKKSMSIAPEYFEVYKIKAFISSEKRDIFDALSNYKIALMKCDTDKERASVLYLFSIFYVIRLNEYDEAYKLITEAEQICPNEVFIKLEKARVTMYLGKFDVASDILNQLESDIPEFTVKMLNIYHSRKAEILRRKAELIDRRDVSSKIILFKQGIDEIEKITNPDYKAYIELLHILNDVSFNYRDNDAIELLTNTLTSHMSSLRSINHNYLKFLRERIFENKHFINQQNYSKLEKLLSDYNSLAKKITEKNEGIIVFQKDHFGFISNAYNKSIFYNKDDLMEELLVGDYVQFTSYNTKKGLVAVHISSAKKRD